MPHPICLPFTLQGINEVIKTLESSKALFGREITLKVDGLGNRLLVQMPTDAPFPTYHLQSCLTIFCTTIMLLQAKEGRDPSAAPRKSLFKK